MNVNKLKLIATKLEVKNNNITGNFKTKNCYGEEKVTRIKKELDINKYNDIYAYGDSNGDKEMLNIATHPFYKSFN